jgi:chromosome segregation ATPase
MDPNDLNLRQLRAELKRLNLSPSGLKSTLVKRLREALGQKVDDDSSDITSHSEKLPAKTTRSNKHKPSLTSHRIIPNKSSTLAKSVTDGDHEGDPDDSENLYQSDIEEKQQDPPFDKRRIVGLSDRELRRRKAKRKRDRDIDSLSWNDSQMDFFSQVALEFNRIKAQRHYEAEIERFQHEIDTLQIELERKNELIRLLQNTIQEKDETLKTLSNCQIPMELVRTWTAVSRAFQLNSTVE